MVWWWCFCQALVLKRAAGDCAGRAQGAFQFRFSAKKGTWWQHGPMVARFQMSSVSVSRSFIGFGWFWSCPLWKMGGIHFVKWCFPHFSPGWSNPDPTLCPGGGDGPSAHLWSLASKLEGQAILGCGSKGLEGVGHSKDGENYDQPVKIGV